MKRKQIKEQLFYYLARPLALYRYDWHTLHAKIENHKLDELRTLEKSLTMRSWV